MTRLLLSLGLFLLLLATGSGVAPATALGERTEVVVALRSPALALAPGTKARIAVEQRAFRHRLAAALPDARVGWSYRLVENGLAVSLRAGELPRLRSLPGVRSVFESGSYSPQLSTTPQEIGAPELWGPDLDTAGRGVKIGIIDSGIDQGHEFFDPAGYSMPAGFQKGQQTYTTAKVIVARAFPPPGSATVSFRTPVDELGHGTHVAGIAAGNAATRASGGRVVSGIAPRAYLGNYKVFNANGNANSPAIVAAVEAAVADGMDVINFSGGEPEIEPSRDIVARALDAAAAAGVVSTIAAGNDYNDLGAGSVSSPANAARAIAVGAVEVTGGAGVHADFSSVGPTALSLRLKPDVAAPGVAVLSAVPDGGWTRYSGTSMAAPHVAGAAALLRQRHPRWTVADITSALVQSGRPVVDEEGEALGPQFQGGGLVTLPAADEPLLFAQPSAISFGLLSGSGVVQEGEITLRDAGGGAGTWTAAVERLVVPAGVSLSLAGSEVSVPGELAYEVRLGTTAREGDVSGYLTLRRGGAVRRIPFWGHVTVQRLARHRPLVLRRPGLFAGTTAGRPALVTRYRYPEDPGRVGVTTRLAGPELVYRFQLVEAAANLGVVVTRRARGVRVEPRVLSGMDENRLAGYAGLPLATNPYLDDVIYTPLLAAGALSPRPGEYAIVFDSGSRTGAGHFAFRFWVNDVSPPSVRLLARTVRSGHEVRIAATDAGSGVYAPSIRVAVDGVWVRHRYRNGVIRVGTASYGRGLHRLRVRVSDYQETKNTENVRRILPNTRWQTMTFRVR